MRKNVFLKSTVRQFARAILLATLIGVASFFFVSRVVEYQIVTTETERIGGFYRSIGYFCGRNSALAQESFAPDDHLYEFQVRQWEGDYSAGDIARGAALISDSPYFDFQVSTRRMFGILDGILNTDIGGGDHINFWRAEKDPAVDATSFALNNEAYIYFIPQRIFAYAGASHLPDHLA